MYVTIVGSEIKAGSFTDDKTGKLIDYNNLYLYGLQEVDKAADKFSFGFSPVIVKIKNTEEDMKKVFGFTPSGQQLMELDNQAVNVYYNQHGRIDSVLLPEKKDKK